MAIEIDPAIIEALALDLSKSTITSYGGGGFSSTFKLTTFVDDKAKLYFVKIGNGIDKEVMFAGEHASLTAIHSAVPSLAPKSHAYGQLRLSKGSFLATDFLNLSSSAPSDSAKSLAQKLVELHMSPSPIPNGFTGPAFGFPVTTCCGDTEQVNEFKSSWADFYAENRLRGILNKGERRHGNDQQLRRLVENIIRVVVPQLLGDGHLKTQGGGKIVPALVHGDLWSGNHGRAIIGKGSVEEMVFDPSSSYSHSEFEFGIMRMFGGFGSSFEREYHALKPKDEPEDEYEDRIALYELYHHLNHYCIFGGSYKGGAERIMKDLLTRYKD